MGVLLGSGDCGLWDLHWSTLCQRRPDLRFCVAHFDPDRSAAYATPNGYTYAVSDPGTSYPYAGTPNSRTDTDAQPRCYGYPHATVHCYGYRYQHSHSFAHPHGPAHRHAYPSSDGDRD